MTCPCPTGKMCEGCFGENWPRGSEWSLDGQFRNSLLCNVLLLRGTADFVLKLFCPSPEPIHSTFSVTFHIVDPFPWTSIHSGMLQQAIKED